jgi:mono/diheme cytochrome c family protein
MRKALKWVGVVLGALVGVVILALAAIYILSGVRFNKTYNVTVEPVTVPTDAASIEEGHRLATIHLCVDCHGSNLAGQVFMNDPAIGSIYSANLTSGKGGVGAEFTNEDFVRVIRHGIDPEGKSVYFMPAGEFYYLNDKDLGDIIAYIRSIPPVDVEHPEPQVGPMGRLFYLLGNFPLMPAELIDQTGTRPAAPAPGPTVAYGEYLAHTCKGCHGENLSGGPVGGTPPDVPPAANLTPGGELVGWTEQDFATAVRTGVKPSGTHLNEFMPTKFFSQMTDDELAAVWAYLQSLPARPFNTQ